MLGSDIDLRMRLLQPEFQQRLREDPVFFCRKVLGIEPWHKQAEVLNALKDNERVAVRSGHGTGKSFIASAAVLWFLYSYYPAKVITTAPTWNQVRQILWSEIRRMHGSSRVPLGGKVLEERIRLSDGAFAIGLSTDEAERFQGFHAENVLVILDEAPGVRREIWEAAQTLLTGSVGKILAIGNPTKPMGDFYEAFAAGSCWKQVRISCLDSPNVISGKNIFPRLVTRKWVEGRRREWGEGTPLWKSRVLGEFPDDETSALIPRAWLENDSDEKGKGALCLGVDVAREGKDATVFLIRNNSRVVYAQEEYGWSTMRVAGWVQHLKKTKKIRSENIFIDDTGLGAGVTDRLREKRYKINAVIAGAKANDSKRFINQRAQMFWRLRERLNPENKNRLCIDKKYGQLRDELRALSYEITSSGAIKIEGKDQLRSKLKGSPNYADALALTYAEVERKDKPRSDIKLTII